jgi:peptidoglycan/LPS O-acetylase OafA/YrhL
MTELTGNPMHAAAVPMYAATVETEARPRVQTLSSRLPSLDGWRAISILVVLGSHTKDTSGFPAENWSFFQHAFDGHLGVRFFFVISGFLITWLMLVENERTGTVNLRHFYVRRALRILPVYLVYLGVLAVLQAFTPFHQSVLGWVGNLTFATNYFHVTHVSDHLWSLAVEEQFYLIWPALFVFFRPQESWRKCLGLLGLTLVVAFLNRFFLGQASDSDRLLQRVFHEWSFFNNVDSLAVGCMAAVLLARAPAELGRRMETSPRLILITGAALISLPVMLSHLPDSVALPSALQSGLHTITLCAGRSLQSIGFALLMVQSVLLAKWGIYKGLNNPLLAQLGVLSYSIYIWQQLFCTRPEVFGLPDVWWMRYPLWFVPVLIVACVSYYGLERPLLQLRHRFR